jgi:hypothetical protein
MNRENMYKSALAPARTLPTVAHRTFFLNKITKSRRQYAEPVVFADYTGFRTLKRKSKCVHRGFYL